MHIVTPAPGPSGVPSAAPTVVTFLVADSELAFGAAQVRDTLENARATRVPGAHDWYDGILAWRGQLVPVLNVARRLGLPEGPGAVVVVVDVAGEPVGLRLDAIAEDAPVPYAELDRPVTVVDPATLVTAPSDNVSPFAVKPGRAKGRTAGAARRGVKRA